MVMIISDCATCAHFHSKFYEYPRCEAFLQGIPKDIWKGKVDHKKPRPGDNGIQYKEISWTKKDLTG